MITESKATTEEVTTMAVQGKQDPQVRQWKQTARLRPTRQRGSGVTVRVDHTAEGERWKARQAS